MLKEVSVEITRKCPNNCLHCSSLSSINCTELISLNNIIQVIGGMKKLGANTVSLSGGEPFVHPYLFETVNHISDKNLICNVYTSGIMLDTQDNPTTLSFQLLSVLKDKLNKLVFNIPAADPSIYNIIMGTKGNFEFVIESIISAKRLEIPTEVHFVPMKINLCQLEKITALCEDLGVPKVSILGLFYHGRALKNAPKLLISDQDSEELKQNIDSLKKSSNTEIRTGMSFQDHSNHFCEAAKGKLNISWDGSVYPCETFKNNKIMLPGKYSPSNINHSNIQSIYRDCSYLVQARRYCGSATTCPGSILKSLNF